MCIVLFLSLALWSRKTVKRISGLSDGALTEQTRVIEMVTHNIAIRHDQSEYNCLDQALTKYCLRTSDCNALCTHNGVPFKSAFYCNINNACEIGEIATDQGIGGQHKKINNTNMHTNSAHNVPALSLLDRFLYQETRVSVDRRYWHDDGSRNEHVCENGILTESVEEGIKCTCSQSTHLLVLPYDHMPHCIPDYSFLNVLGNR